jgi:3-hydroxyacyl-CoA dehydrogenase
MIDGKIRYMMDFVTTEIILLIMENTELAAPEAMKAFYNSEVFERLCDSGTGLYRESGGYVYELYKTEREYGRLVQTEI